MFYNLIHGWFLVDEMVLKVFRYIQHTKNACKEYRLYINFVVHYCTGKPGAESGERK